MLNDSKIIVPQQTVLINTAVVNGLFNDIVDFKMQIKIITHTPSQLSLNDNL